MGILIDTSALIHIEREKREPLEVLREFGQEKAVERDFLGVPGLRVKNWGSTGVS